MNDLFKKIRIFLPSSLAMVIGALVVHSCGKPLVSTERLERKFFIDSLLQEMTMDEKIGQLNLLTSDWDISGPILRKDYKALLKSGKVGALFNAHTVEYNREMQRIAVEDSRLGIPLLFGYDVIHGHKTIFPIPLAESCSWNLELIEKSAKLSAKEAAASGLNWTFNPMVDVSRDPRWGRVAEGNGEDSFLASLIAARKVRGYQGDDLKNEFTVLACVKHFAAYGAPLAGRDYGVVDMSERALRETYLPPYQAAVDAGAMTVMTSFNELNGVPVTASKELLTNVLRGEWSFQGFVVSDYTAINELVNHGVAHDEKNAGELAFNAGVDMDMQGSIFMDHLKTSIEEGDVDVKELDSAVSRILTAKYRLGLFDDPYLYLNTEREEKVVRSDEMTNQALASARESVVLLKNDTLNGETLLPLAQSVRKVALIGPLADNQVDLLGSWHAAGDGEHIETLKEALIKSAPSVEFSYAFGTGFGNSDKGDFDEAIEIAKKSDVILMVLGESYLQNGEAASRSKISLPGNQRDLLKALKKVGKPIVLIVMAGRPLVLSEEVKDASAILYAWHLGTKAGDVLAEIIWGITNPSGKLTMTFPRNEGQIPIFYNAKNTGRPYSRSDKYTSKYLDVLNTPLFPFGYGLSYTSFEYSNLQINKEAFFPEEKIELSVEVKNVGTRAGKEVIQLYVRDIVGSVTRPLKELKGFKKISLNPGESQLVTFALTPEDLAFFTKDMVFQAEPGDFEVFVGTSSAECLKSKFTLK